MRHSLCKYVSSLQNDPSWVVYILETGGQAYIDNILYP
jgi:hypothetical protein